MPEYQLSIKVSDIQASGGKSGGNSGGGGLRKGGRNSGSICNSQGKFHTGYYQNWKDLREEDLKAVIAAYKQKGSNYSQTARKKDLAYIKRHISEILSTHTEMKVCIDAFIGKPQRTNSSKSNSGQEDPVSGDSGNSFGRRASKRTKDWFASPLALALFLFNYVN